MLLIVAFGYGILTSAISGFFSFNVTTYMLEEHARHVEIEKENLKKQRHENKLIEYRIHQIKMNEQIRRERNKETLQKLKKSNNDINLKTTSLPIVSFSKSNKFTLIKSSSEMSNSYKENLWWERNDFDKFQKDHLTSDEYYF